ncbi:HI1506-related protein [Solimonas flava]|uniref:HI1506-related protein n=1 Tax=Solimonas flava TaxID=415849 RepID=UPI0004171F9A|nr:HI1506-related protein [Solimonas flava]
MATQKVLRVTAKREGFRRAGITFGSASVDLPIADLKKEQIEALKSEPMLVAVEAEAEIAEAPKKAAK